MTVSWKMERNVEERWRVSVSFQCGSNVFAKKRQQYPAPVMLQGELLEMAERFVKDGAVPSAMCQLVKQRALLHRGLIPSDTLCL